LQSDDNLVTVLIPNLNGARYLAQCLNSVLRQTHNAEILVIDNNSTDESMPILEEFSRQYSRVKYLQEKNQGICHSLNLGLDHCTTDFIARLDADDIMSEDRIRIQSTYLQLNPKIVAVGSQVSFIDSTSKIIGVSRYPENYHSIRKSLTYMNPIAHPSVMYRREAVIHVGKYRVDYEGAEDLDLWFRLLTWGEIVNLPDKLTAYRLHDGQVTRNYNYYLQDYKVRRAHSKFVCTSRKFTTSQILIYIIRTIYSFVMSVSNSHKASDIFRNIFHKAIKNPKKPIY
jgi:glycosyltransferase involved in cell wall biosynthesis